MKQQILTSASACALASFGLVLGACSGGSESTGSSSSNSFAIDSVSVLAGSTWQINREIEVRFNSDVDFSSVNLNTIQVGQVGGAPAAGEFRQAVAPDGITIDPRRIIFAPRCPTLADYSDAGLVPGGIPYRINIVGGSGFTARSMGGQGLLLGLTVNFSTPNSPDASVLFVDTVPGPPAAIIRTTPDNLNASYLELGGSSAVADRRYFTYPVGQPVDAELGAEIENQPFAAPLNLYSDVTSQLAAVIVVNQAVDPSSNNVNPGNIRMEYQEGATWVPIAHTVELSANCTQTGALLRVVPTGILPQERIVRIVFSSGLRDVVGDGNLVDIVIGSFEVAANPGQGVDEYLEEFTTNAGADQVSQAVNPAAPRAKWDNGVLSPNFDFPGTGGPPDGQFDYEIGSSIIGAPTENPILDTTFTLISDTTGSRQQAVVNGVVDVRNFTINEGSTLTVLGPNPLKIYASGNVRISGSLLVRGSNNHGVATLGTACQPETGATGQAGGGKGGTASYLTTQSTPKGEDGYGPFNQPGQGGGGGHTAYKATGSEEYIGASRRPGGGAGGRFGNDLMETARPTCPDQSFVGLDAESGFPGTPGANDAILGSGVKPVGGTRGPTPFTDGDNNNDFWGVKVMNATGIVVQGELSQPWAGSGGGGGGNTCTTNNFPTTPFTCQGDEKGCGGGGGGGSVLLMALGDITLTARGKIDVGGGCGGGGENSASGVGIQRIGGGSGGGSGGHIILESASQINLSACVVANGAGLFARGGQGGAGKNDAGGAHAPGTPVGPSLDALPFNSYPSTNTATPCRVVNTISTGTFTYSFNNTVGNGTVPSGTNDGAADNVVTCCGGDGGPGIIQLHVQSLATDLLLPAVTSTNPMRLICSPTPSGALPTNLQTPGTWDQMLPHFGRFSTGLSNWIPLGSASVTPGSPIPHAVQFLFGGTDVLTGRVTTNSGTVTELPEILGGSLAAEPTMPFVTADRRTIVFDPTGLDPIYTQNPNLMKRFGVLLTQGPTTTQFEVVSASYSGGQLRLTVATSGTPLPANPAGYTVSVRPRFFRVITNNVPGALPASSTIQVRFQAAPADVSGNPLVTAATAFLTDATALQNDPNAANFKFVRFRVDFDILADGSALTFTTPRPTVDFLRLPFKF